MAKKNKPNITKETVVATSTKPEEWAKRPKKPRKPGRKKTRGRKLFDGKSEKSVLSKLFTAWDADCSDRQACLHARISEAALQRYYDLHPELREERRVHKQNMVLKAKLALMADLKNTFTRGKNAQWILERKEPKKYNLLQKIQVGEDKSNPFGGTLAEAFIGIMNIDDAKEKQRIMDGRVSIPEKASDELNKE